MTNTEDKPIEGATSFITFKELVEEVCNAPFEEIFKGLLKKIDGDENDKTKS